MKVALLLVLLLIALLQRAVLPNSSLPWHVCSSTTCYMNG
jgi:hypothetical protein